MSAPGAGSIQVRLQLRDGAVAEVRLHSSRPVGIGNVLAGRTPEEAIALLPRLFTLCGLAHDSAARAALQAAAGQAPSPKLAAMRERRVLAEMLDAHAWNVLLAWPAMLGEAPDAIGQRALCRATQALRDGTLAERRRALTEVEALLAASVFGRGGWAEAAADVPHWAATAGTPAARMLRAVMARGREGFGAGPWPMMVPFAAAWCLAEDARFAALPVQRGAPAEAAPSLDQSGTALVRGLAVRHGHGLLARLAGRLAALSALPRRIGSLLHAEAEEPPLTAQDGDGVGHAETARGPLLHWVQVEDGRLREWRVLAPTEWNFHPDGPAVRGLIGAKDGPDLVERAQWHLAALDPCVPCTVRVENAEA